MYAQDKDGQLCGAVVRDKLSKRTTEVYARQVRYADNAVFIDLLRSAEILAINTEIQQAMWAALAVMQAC